MDKRERVTAVFTGGGADHVPVCMWKHVPQRFWADFDAFAECQAAFYRATDVDFMKLSGDGFFGWPSPVLSPGMRAADLYKAEPLGPGHPYIRDQVARTRAVVKALGRECVTLYLVFAPLSAVRLAVGYPAMMRLMREDPRAMMHACAAAAEDQKALVTGILEEAGADGIFYSVQNGERDRFTLEEYRAFVTPSDKAVLDHANGLSKMNAIHFCAWEGVPNRLENWADYRAPVVSWSRYMDIMDITGAQRHFGCTVWGGFDNRPGTDLYTLDRAEIERTCAAFIARGGKSRYILGADCSLHDGLPEERIRWAVEAARRV